jgi:hypothetical protein
MVSTLPYISREEMDELENELRTTKPGWSPDIDAFQIRILLDLIAAFRNGTPGVQVHPDTAANNSPLAPDGVMFDAFGNPRKRFVRVSYNGAHAILSTVEIAAWKMEAEAAAASIGRTDPHTYSDVYLSEEEADALPEFDGF